MAAEQKYGGWRERLRSVHARKSRIGGASKAPPPPPPPPPPPGSAALDKYNTTAIAQWQLLRAGETVQWSLHHNKTSPCLRSNSFLYIYGTLLHFSTILSMSLACTHNVSVCVTCVSWLFTLTCLLPSFLVAPVLNYTFIIYYKATSILAILVVRACLLQQRKKKMEERQPV